MRILLLITALLLLSACEQQKTAEKRTQEIQTFADPQIDAYKKARQVQGVYDAEEEKHKNSMKENEAE